MAADVAILRQGPTRLEIGDLDAECDCPNTPVLGLGPPTPCSSSAEAAADTFCSSCAVWDGDSIG